MGNVHAYRGRLTPALILVALVALAVVALGMVAGPASAHADVHDLCSSCHNYAMQRRLPPASRPTAAQTAAHVPRRRVSDRGRSAPSACATLATARPSDVLAQADARRPTRCGTTPGCHGVPPAVVTTTMTREGRPDDRQARARRSRTTGTAGPAASLAGAKVALKVERKVGHQVGQDEDRHRHRERRPAPTRGRYKAAEEGHAPRDGVDRQRPARTPPRSSSRRSR